MTRIYEITKHGGTTLVPEHRIARIRTLWHYGADGRPDRDPEACVDFVDGSSERAVSVTSVEVVPNTAGARAFEVTEDEDEDEIEGVEVPCHALEIRRLVAGEPAYWISVTPLGECHGNRSELLMADAQGRVFSAIYSDPMPIEEYLRRRREEHAEAEAKVAAPKARKPKTVRKGRQP